MMENGKSFAVVVWVTSDNVPHSRVFCDFDKLFVFLDALDKLVGGDVKSYVVKDWFLSDF